MVDNKKLAEIFELSEDEVEIIKEAAQVYQLDKDNEGYKDWIKMYEGVHREMSGETAIRHWLAFARWSNRIRMERIKSVIDCMPDGEDDG